MVWLCELGPAAQPLGSVRGVEGLTCWEYVLFAALADRRYRSGDAERADEEEARLDFDEEWYADAELEPEEDWDSLSESTGHSESD